jgi:hypothetical protein
MNASDLINALQRLVKKHGKEKNVPLTFEQKLIIILGSILIVILLGILVTRQEDARSWQVVRQENAQQQARFTELIQQHRLAVGMTANQVRESIGEPSRINRTVGRKSISEEWVYRETYLYLDDGVLSSFKGSRQP